MTGSPKTPTIERPLSQFSSKGGVFGFRPQIACNGQLRGASANGKHIGSIDSFGGCLPQPLNHQNFSARWLLNQCAQTDGKVHIELRQKPHCFSVWF